ncbi:MAG: GldG family protein [Chloroflexi bacterium]|nr:GldG family protein [Chloroflexota bacterium]
MKQTFDKIAPYLPGLGLVMLIGGAAAYFVTRRWDLLPNLLIGGGLLCLLGFAMLRPDTVRERLSGRYARYGTGNLIFILLFTTLFVFIYILTANNEDWRIDATETNEFTPLAETVTILDGLDEPVHVIGFYNFQTLVQQEEARSRLESLQAFTNQLTYEFVDPEENPLLAERYELTFNGTLVFIKGEGENEVFTKANAPLDDRAIHAALLQVINPVEKKVYFITGHGEKDSESFEADGLGTAVRLLQENGFEVDTLTLFVAGEIPEDATSIAIIDQQTPMQQEEVAAIKTYLDQGGTAFIARDAIENEGRLRVEGGAFTTYLADEWGVTWRPDFVIEQVFAQAGQSFGLSFLGASYGVSTITTDLEQFGTIFDIARSLQLTPPDEVARVNLITTSDQAWGETDFNGLSAGIAEPNPELDAVGALTIAASLENRESNGRLIIVGDTNFMDNTLLLQSGNSFLMNNAFNWLADDEIAVELTPRESVLRQVTMSQTQLNLIQLTVLFLMPGLIAIIGIVVWFSRRQTR